MADEEYETPIHLIPVNQPNNSTIPNGENMSQQMPSQQIYSSEMSPQMSPQQMYSSDVYPSATLQQPYTTSRKNKLFETFKNLDLGDSIQSIIIIVILFVIFSNNYFKQICGTMPFLCIREGEFNIQSLIILGFVFGVCFIFIKNYAI